MFNNEWLDKNAFTVKKIKLKGCNSPLTGIIVPHHYQGGALTSTMVLAPTVIRVISIDGRVALLNIADCESVQVTRIMDESLRTVIDEVIKVAKEWNKCNLNLIEGVEGYTFERLINAESILKNVISYLPDAYAKANVGQKTVKSDL